jgi:hypothetical protein
MTNKKSKMVTIEEPKVTADSTLSAEVRKVFNTSVSKLIKITGDNENAISNLSAVVEQQLYDNDCVVEKTVDFKVGTAVEYLQRLVIPYDTWGEYLTLIERQEFKKGNWDIVGGEISTAEHTKLKSRATTILNRIKKDLETATVEIAFYWAPCENQEAIDKAIMRDNAVDSYGQQVREICVNHSVTPEAAIDGINFELAKKGQDKINQTEKKAIIADFNAETKEVEKEYVDTATEWLKTFKAAPLAIKKVAIPQLLEIKLS